MRGAIKYLPGGGRRFRWLGGLKLYELLIKSGSAPVSPAAAKKGATGGTYQDGDIIAIRPAGFLWGVSERTNFTIVRAYLTDAEAEELTKPQEMVKGTDKSGRPVKEIVRIRKHKVDLKKKGVLQRTAPAIKGLSQNVPLIDRNAIVEKTTGSE